jgi:subtilisin family serine protease
MARFVLARRLAAAPTAGAPEAAAPLERVRQFAASVGGKAAPTPAATGRRGAIIEADPREVESKRADLPADFVLEPLLARRPAVVRFDAVPRAEDAPAGIGTGFGLSVRTGGNAAAGARVVLVLAGAAGATSLQAGTTGPDGAARFVYDPRQWAPSAAIVVPRSGAWSWCQQSPRNNAPIDLPALPASGPLGWWHQLMGISDAAARGAGIRVGVIDTGLGPHPYLAHVTGVGAFIDGGFDSSPAATADVDDHGTHVTGIIAARPAAGSGQFAGLAPDAEVFAARVFPGSAAAPAANAPQPGAREPQAPAEGAAAGPPRAVGNPGTANQLDIANAIDHLSTESGVDLINLSLGDATPSEVEQDAVNRAFERGTLVICAAGNNTPTVLYPAAYPASVAVSALGLVGTVPPSSLAATAQPAAPDRYAAGGLYVAGTSAVGPKIGCTGPGVGVISTVPAGAGEAAPYADMTGTSMASPCVCGCLAVVLSKDQVYRGLPRSSARAERAALALATVLRSLGLNPSYQGGGVPVRPPPP